MEQSETVEYNIDATTVAAEQRAPISQRAILFAVAGVVLFIDQLSKGWIVANLDLYEIWAPFPALEPFFRILHATNTGTAFGLFPDGSLFFGLMAAVVALGIIIYNRSIPADNNLLRVALGLTMGGAIGNLIDRLRLGHVTDFLDFGPWPVFNVADMAVVGGAILLGWLVIQDARHEQQQARLQAVANQEAHTPENSTIADETLGTQQIVQEAD